MSAGPDDMSPLAVISRRAAVSVGAGALFGASQAFARGDASLPFAKGLRPLTSAYPQKGEMLLLRSRPPLLETPFAVFDRDVITPNQSFYVRWHLANIPTTIDPATFRLDVHGHVMKTLRLSLPDLAQFPAFELVAVNQCAGNSRGLFEPRVPGAQWGNGAMGNARWTGVRLRDVLARAGIKDGATVVRFCGLDEGVLPGTPRYLKSLPVDVATDNDVMIAYAMNGEALPLLNGFPLRLVVPGYFATYWVKMLSDVEVLAGADDNFWMAKAYRIPTTPHASITPGQEGVPTVPIGRMPPRSFFTGLTDGATVRVGATLRVRGLAFGGDRALAGVDVSQDGGKSWRAARLGEDLGPYSFRRWELPLRVGGRGPLVLTVKARNVEGVEQPLAPNWNPSGYMRNACETLTIRGV